MKRKISLAVLAAIGACSAHAQSSVTLFGVVDIALQAGRGSLSDRTQLVSGSNGSSRLGLRGTEDLGGGLSASFWFEGQLNADSGAGAASNTNNQASGGAIAGIGGGQGLTFNRRSTVGLAGPWGEIRLGRDYTPQFWNANLADPFGSVGVGISQAYSGVSGIVTSVRASNSIGYFLPPKLGGIYGQAQYYLGENASNIPTSDDGKGGAVRIGYRAGPFDGAVSASTTKYLAGDARQRSVFASWNFGVARLIGMASSDSIGAANGRGRLLAITAPLGSGQLKLSYTSYRGLQLATRPEAKKLAIGYVHDLSKRSALYGTYARVRNSGGATVALGGSTTAPNSNSSGIEFGLRHTF